MDNFRMLIDAHLNLRKLEKMMKKERVNLIKEYKNKSCSNSHWYTSKISLTAFAVEFKKETAKFEKVLSELDEMDGLSVSSISNDNDDDEIMNNLESSDCDSSISSSIDSDKAYSKLLNHSVPITENLDVDEIQINVESEEQDKEEEEEEEEEGEEEKEKEEELPKPKNNDDNNDNINNKIEEPPTLNNNDSFKNVEEYRVFIKNKNKKPRKIASVHTGYKYEGKGFTVFTNSRNRGRAIYSSTMLFCYQTCDGNKAELKNYLIKYGKFKMDMIEDIVFKTGYNRNRGNYNYALIKVRGKLKYIKNKIKTLNKAFKDNKNNKGDILRIFERVTYRSAMDYANISNVLYVNNFDILRGDSHKRFTKLLLRYGDLMKDIYMGLDKQQKDPFAIIHFKDVNDAKRCFEERGQLMFDGKVLNIKFSKF